MFICPYNEERIIHLYTKYSVCTICISLSLPMYSLARWNLRDLQLWISMHSPIRIVYYWSEFIASSDIRQRVKNRENGLDFYITLTSFSCSIQYNFFDYFKITTL